MLAYEVDIGSSVDFKKDEIDAIKPICHSPINKRVAKGPDKTKNRLRKVNTSCKERYVGARAVASM